MILEDYSYAFYMMGIPRESGDDPYTLKFLSSPILYSPRERG